MANTTKAWHFVCDDSTIFTDSMRRPLKVHKGQILRHRGPLKLCKKGLHASIKSLDALKYAPGSVVCRVECSGDVIHGEDKLVCSRRKVLWMADASRTLHEFTIWCTETALSEIKNPDPRSLKAIEVKKLWIDEKATDEKLKAAEIAAWDAAIVAARDTTRSVSRDAAWNAARCAARDAAWYAAREIARAACRFAAQDIVRESRNEELEKRLLALHPH
jgi:hypothetical protein